jgi:serine/threonine protein kinase
MWCDVVPIVPPRPDSHLTSSIPLSHSLHPDPPPPHSRLPYFEHLDFRAYFLTMSIEDMQYYMWSLLYSLTHVHECGIIHRDIKPSNFLYSVEQRRGVLVDFGLAHVGRRGPVTVESLWMTPQ